MARFPLGPQLLGCRLLGWPRWSSRWGSPRPQRVFQMARNCRALSFLPDGFRLLKPRTGALPLRPLRDPFRAEIPQPHLLSCGSLPSWFVPGWKHLLRCQRPSPWTRRPRKHLEVSHDFKDREGRSGGNALVQRLRGPIRSDPWTQRRGARGASGKQGHHRSHDPLVSMHRPGNRRLRLLHRWRPSASRLRCRVSKSSRVRVSPSKRSLPVGVLRLRDVGCRSPVLSSRQRPRPRCLNRPLMRDSCRSLIARMQSDGRVSFHQ
jgi:hypothetical protein